MGLLGAVRHSVHSACRRAVWSLNALRCVPYRTYDVHSEHLAGDGH